MGVMAVHESSKPDKLWRAIVWTLRITVALQCLGNWRWLTQIGESPLLSWWIGPTDVGGLAWNEATGLAVQQATGWLALAAGGCVLLRPCAAVLGPLVLLQIFFAIAMWRTDAGFSLQAPWLGPRLGALFPFATQLARIVAPLGLLLLDPWRVERPLGPLRVGRAIRLLRWGIACTFLAHGIEAWLLNPVFIDLLIGSFQHLLSVQLSQSAAEELLQIIGGVDLLAAIACVSTRSRDVLWWMAFWGGITALSRMTAFGFETSWHTTLIRTPHLGVPLAVVLYWHLLRWGEASAPESQE